MTDSSSRGHKVVAGSVLTLLLLSFAITYSGPLWDIDLWWHLAYGRYIVEHAALLPAGVDLFSFAGIEANAGVSPAVLNGYWLAQVAFYAAFSFFGHAGLVGLRVLLLLLCLLVVYSASRSLKASRWDSLFFTALAGWAAGRFTGERPQLFSFLMAPLLLWLLVVLRRRVEEDKDATLRLWLLPVLMVLWANLHRGFILGAALILLFGISESVKVVMARGRMSDRFLIFNGFLLLSVAASAINPHTFWPYADAFQFEGSPLQQRISEYLSPVTLALKHSDIIAPYWLYVLILILLLVVMFRKSDKTHSCIMVFLLLMSLTAVRYVPFLFFVSSVLAAHYVTDFATGRPALRRIFDGLAALSVAVIIVAGAWGYRGTLGQTLRHELKENRFPERAADFVRANAPAGNIFNHFNWGGFLIWRLYPEYKVFVDSRTMNLKALGAYTHMLWNDSAAARLFDLYSIKTIVMPGLNPLTGELYRLIGVLAQDPQWHLVFADDAALIFVRGEENRDLIREREIPKEKAYSHVIRQAGNILRSDAGSVNAWLSLATAYRETGLLRQAEEAHARAAELSGKR